MQSHCNDSYHISKNLSIPAIGFGTYRLPDDETGAEAVATAIGTGYRLIDGASAYDNEKSIGEGIRFCGVPRGELFIASKVWTSDRGYDRTMRAFERSLKRLDLTYLDLYMIHWPATEGQTPDWKKVNIDTWRALVRLLEEKAVRSIGVCNFMPEQLNALAEDTSVLPRVNQIEFNPGMKKPQTIGWCRENNIRVEAWSPLGRGRILDNPLLRELGAKYGKTSAQIALRWEVQQEIIPIPKSSNPGRMRENIDIFDFSLTSGEMKRLGDLPTFGNSGLDPLTFDR